MSKCNVSLTVDGWQAMGDVAPTFRVGQPITGTVHVWVSAPVRCDGLDVELVPIRTTRGYALGLELPRVRVFEGQWEPGEYDYRFSVPSSWLPSFRGRHLGWSWVARASADIPWALDPESDSPFEVEPGDELPELDIVAPDETKVERSNRLLPLLGGVFVLSLLAIAGGLLAANFDVADDELMSDLAAVGVAVCVFSLMAIGAASRGQVTSSSIEDVVLRQRRGGGDYRSGGGSFIDCEARSKADVTSMIARLVIEELAEWKTTKNDHTTTHRRHHLIHQHDAELIADGAGGWRGSLTVPEPGSVPPFSIGIPPGHGIVWKVELLTMLRGKSKPEVTRRYLHVRPRGARSPAP